MLCAVPSRLRKLRGGEKIKDAGREASCLSYTSPRRAGDRSAVCLGFAVRVCSREPESSAGTRHKSGWKARDPYLHASTCNTRAPSGASGSKTLASQATGAAAAK